MTASMQSQENCRNVRLLDVRGHYNCVLTSMPLIQMAKNCKQLTEIYLNNMTFFPKFMIELVKHCPQLEEFHAVNGRGLVSADIVVLVSHCPNLCIVDISDTGAESTAVLQAVATHSKHLTSFSISAFYDEHSVYPCIDADILAVVKNCPKLTNLKLSYKTGITDKTLELITPYLRNLTTFASCNNKMITNRCFQHIAKHCVNLCALCLQGCGLGVTSVGVVFIAAACNELRFLSVREGVLTAEEEADLKMLHPRMNILQYVRA